MNVSLALSVLSTCGLIVVALALGSVMSEVRFLRRQVVSLRKLSGVEVKLLDSETRAEVIDSLEIGGSGALVLVVDESCGICDDVIPLFVDIASGSSTEFSAAVVSRARTKQHRTAGRVRFIDDRALHHHLDPGYLPAFHVINADGEAVLTEPVGSRSGLAEALALAGVAVKN